MTTADALIELALVVIPALLLLLIAPAEREE
jgi:hypothetical protein